MRSILQAGALWASAYNVNGVVADVSGQGEPFATYRIYAANDSLKPVSIGVTDVDGRFVQLLDSAGRYRITVQAVNKKPIDRETGCKQLRQDWRLKEITTHQRVADFHQTVLAACVDVSNVLVAYKNNHEIISHLAKRYEALFNAYTYSRQLNSANRADYLDVISAQNQLLNARFELSDAMVAYYINRVAIYRALGGGSL